METYTLRITSPARAGLVAAVTTHLAHKGCYINEMAQYDDRESGRLFLRCEFTTNMPKATALDALGHEFKLVAELYSMEYRIRSSLTPQRVLLLVSKFDHCLRDLLYRLEKREFQMDVVGIVSNHPDLEPIAARARVPYHHLPVNPKNKAEQEQALRTLIQDQRVDLVILARYMQILSDDLTRELSGRCINIHHSFLPSFKGGSPYAQAHQRGVKLIGATAHYVTGDLDEGPIIEQDLRRIDHRNSVQSMQALGRDIESRVLAHAVRMHLEDRVFIDGNKTVVFS